MTATQESVAAVTSVFWNIKACPVPPGFDARRVGPCIKRFLEKLGYSGPLTISAIGLLTDIPDEVLRAVSSTGVVLVIDPFGSDSLSSHMFCWAHENQPPANIMLITDPTYRDSCLDLHMLEHQMGYNIIKPYPFGPASTNAECLWESFLLAESAALEEEDKCIETTGESAWVCAVCHSRGLPGQGFENFTTHLSSEEHAQEKLGWFPPVAAECDEEEDEEAVEARVEPPWEWEWYPPQRWSHPSTPIECPLAYDTTMLMHQPKTWECFHTHPHMSATPTECPRGYATTMLIIQPKTWECFPTHPHMFATPTECPRGYATTMGMIQPTCFPPHPHMFASPSESHGQNEPELKRKKPMT